MRFSQYIKTSLSNKSQNALSRYTVEICRGECLQNLAYERLAKSLLVVYAILHQTHLLLPSDPYTVSRQSVDMLVQLIYIRQEACKSYPEVDGLPSIL